MKSYINIFRHFFDHFFDIFFDHFQNAEVPKSYARRSASGDRDRDRDREPRSGNTRNRDSSSENDRVSKSEIKEPNLTWVQCPGESGIPGKTWNQIFIH